MSEAPNTPAPISQTPAEAANPALTPTAPEAQAAAPAPAPKAPEPPKSTKKKYSIKVDKRDEEVEFDPNNDEEVKQYLQKAKASDRRFQEAAEIRKAAMEFIDQLKKNPKKVLSDPTIGVDVKKFAEEIINEQLADMEKSPEQRERERLTKELEDLKAQAKEKDENIQRAEFSRMQAEQERHLETEISAALDVGGLPKTPRTVARMAEMMMIALNNGIDLGVKDIVPIVKNNTMSEFKEIINSLADEQLEDFIGKEVLGRIRKKNVAKAKAVDTAAQVKTTGQTSKEKPKEDVKKMTYKQFFGI